MELFRPTSCPSLAKEGGCSRSIGEIDIARWTSPSPPSKGEPTHGIKIDTAGRIKIDTAGVAHV